MLQNGPKNRASAFLPSQHQGTIIRTERREPFPPTKVPAPSPPGAERGAGALLEKLNLKYADERPDDSRLGARIQRYEFATRMQLAIPEALDPSKE